MKLFGKFQKEKSNDALSGPERGVCATDGFGNGVDSGGIALCGGTFGVDAA